MASDAYAQLNLFLLVLMRMSGCVFLNPILGRKHIPSSIKTALTLVLAVTAYLFLSNYQTGIQINSIIVFYFYMLWEFIVGFVVGFVMQMVFGVVTWAGGILDFVMGMSMATVYDPQNGQPVAITGNLLNIFLTLMFFKADGHLLLLKIIFHSFEILPYGQPGLMTFVSNAMINLFAELFLLAVKISFPILAAEFLMEIVMGILMKLVAQINIFMINIQLKILLGYCMLLFLVIPMSDIMNQLINRVFAEIPRFLRLM